MKRYPMRGGCDCCLKQSNIEPALHRVSGRHCYVCDAPGCLAQVVLIDWQAQWEAFYQERETRWQQQQTRKTFGHVA